MKKNARSALYVAAALAGMVFPPAPLSAGMQTSQAGAEVAAAPENPEWDMRCAESGENAGRCEIFQRLLVRGERRLAEFTVNFPPDTKLASGLVILPLGVLLPEGGGMQIDGGKIYRFQFRYCTAAGCFAYVNLNDKILKAMSAGDSIGFQCKTFTGQDVEVKMPLDGFSAALEKLRISEAARAASPAQP